MRKSGHDDSTNLQNQVTAHVLVSLGGLVASLVLGEYLVSVGLTTVKHVVLSLGVSAVVVASGRLYRLLDEVETRFPTI